MNCVMRFRKKKEINLTTGAAPSPGGSEQRNAALCRPLRKHTGCTLSAKKVFPRKCLQSLAWE